MDAAVSQFADEIKRLPTIPEHPLEDTILVDQMVEKFTAEHSDIAAGLSPEQIREVVEGAMSEAFDS
jgi:hypothetical protein